MKKNKSKTYWIKLPFMILMYLLWEIDCPHEMKVQGSFYILGIMSLLNSIIDNS